MVGMCGMYHGMGYTPPSNNFGYGWRYAEPSWPQPNHHDNDDSPPLRHHERRDGFEQMVSTTELVVSSRQDRLWNWSLNAFSKWILGFLIFFWPAAAILKKTGLWSWEFLINVCLCWQGRQLLEYFTADPPEIAVYENYYNYVLAILPAMLHAWFFVLKPKPVTATQIINLMFPSRNFSGLFVFVWPPVAVWMESGLWSLDFLISCCLWEPLLEYPVNPSIMGLFVSCLVASVLYAWYVVRRPKPVPISALGITGSRYNISYWDIIFSLGVIIFFPFLCVLQRRGFWSLDFPINIGLCVFAQLRWSSLKHIRWYNIRFLCLGLLPCVFHAWYIVATTSKGLFVFNRFRGWELWQVERRRVRIGDKEQELGKMVEQWGLGSLKHG